MKFYFYLRIRIGLELLKRLGRMRVMDNEMSNQLDTGSRWLTGKTTNSSSILSF
jgi:hypothetical protein